MPDTTNDPVHLTSLRWVTLVGPRIGEGNAARRFWTLSAGAPHFHHDNARDEQNKPSGVTVDHVHTIRVLAADSASGKAAWRQPRLLSAHLVLGAQDDHYKGVDDALTISFLKAPWRISGEVGRLLRTVREEDLVHAAAEPPKPEAIDGKAPFVQVVVEPLAEEGKTWPPIDSAPTEIQVPSMRLVSGRVSVQVVLVDANGKPTSAHWLTKLRIRTLKQGKEISAIIWLVPDGIEFDADRLPFPGATEPLKARVLLAPETPAAERYKLTLLHPAPGSEAKWRDAWTTLLPSQGQDEDALLGLKFAGRREGRVPAVRWSVNLSGGVPGWDLEPSVEIPEVDLRVALVSPRVRGDVDGVATLRTGWVTASQDAGVVSFAFGKTGPSAPSAMGLVLVCSADKLEIKPTTAASASFELDAERLAAMLRRSYGIDAPPAVPGLLEPNALAGPGYDRPTLSAFVPLADGWLQLPVPNFGSVDTSHDSNLATVPSQQGMLAAGVFDGYFRIKQIGPAPFVLSAYPPRAPAKLREAPWSITINRAAGLDAIIEVIPSVSGLGSTLKSARITLQGLTLSARGLLWFSADRPDALEALPRLGAGPGAFFDVDLESGTSDGPLQIAIKGLSVEAGRAKPPFELTDRASLTNVEISFHFATGSRRWRDELLKPREARIALAQERHVVNGLPIPEIIRPNEALRLEIAARQRDVEVAVAQAHILRDTAKWLHGQLDEIKDRQGAPKPDITKARDDLRAVEVQLASAEDRAEQARAALKKASVSFGNSAFGYEPWFPVLWRRHPLVPLAAGMPMTRMAASAVRPLESRDLIPLAVQVAPPTGDGVFHLATLKRSSGMPLPILSEDEGNLQVIPIAAWPWHDGTAESTDRPERGIAFAALGLPGVELRPKSASPAVSTESVLYEAAVRYDLPALDEAFATASLPPRPPSEPRIAEKPKPVVTALDWPLLASFWAEQERKHQNARVVDSYFSGFATTDAASPVGVSNLIGGLRWDVSVGVTMQVAGDMIPYGRLAIGDQAAQQGNAVLLGYQGNFRPDLATGTLTADDAGSVTVLGFTPATFKPGSMHLDNRLVGADVPTTNGDMLSRAITFPGAAADARLLTLIKPIEATVEAMVDGSVEQRPLRFWFKDVLFEGNDAQFENGAAGLSFDVWDNDRKLARAGFDWRLAPAGSDASNGAARAEGAFRAGRSEIPLFGFGLEPLRLTQLNVADHMVASAQILCRLTLGPREGVPDPATNLVTLHLTAKGDGKLKAHLSPATSVPLQFDFTMVTKQRDSQTISRRVTLSAALEGSDRFVLRPLSLSVEIAGVALELGEPTVALSNGQIDGRSHPELVIIAGKAKAPVPEPGHAQLTVTSATLTTGLVIKQADGGAPAIVEPLIPTLALTRSVTVVPKDDTAIPVHAVISCDSDGRMSFCGRTVRGCEVNIGESAGAVTLMVRDGTLGIGNAPQSEWCVAFGLIARPHTEGKAGVLELVAGYCEGEVVQKQVGQTGPHVLSSDIAVEDCRVDFVLEAPAATGIWTGTATIDGQVTARSAIHWPAVGWKSDEIPLPRDMVTRPRNGRVIVTPKAEASAKHEMVWRFSGHRLTAALAAAIVEPNGRGNVLAAWVVPVMVRHTLRNGSKSLTWTGLETISVGPASVIVPKLADLKDDATIFAARYRRMIKNGQIGALEPGMKRPGEGAVSTVLQGMSGRAFREAWTIEPSRIIVAGGFLGTVRHDDKEVAYLLRLPSLIGLGTLEIRQDVPEAGLEVSWTDGPAARILAVSRPGASSPASASSDALTAALIAGSRASPLLSTGGHSDDPVGSLLVEQSFVNADLSNGATLEKTPFFLSAAVTVQRVFDSLPEGDSTGEALSLVAGSIKRHSPGAPSRTLPLAAAIAARNASPMRTPRMVRPRLMILGAGLSEINWTGPNPFDSGVSSAPFVSGLAVSHDVDPRASLIIWPYTDAKGRDLTRFEARGLVPAVPVVLSKAGSIHNGFADHGRGLLAAPEEAEPLRWLAPPLEGAINPIRDAKSGLAGLSRGMALPAHAGPSAAVTPNASVSLTWLSQTQVPIYLPLHTFALKGPPIGWLAPAPAAVRLPTDGDVMRAIADTDESEHKVTRTVQPILPDVIHTASVGERAGVMTVRRTRLLTSLGPIAAFDPLNPRFGRPAQAGSSVPRKIRTPRPGPIPPNTGDSLHDRRIQASKLRPCDALSAFIGSADVIQGSTATSGAWSIVVVCAPEIESTISDQWDGTLRLVCRIEVVTKDNSKPEPRPVDFLANALLKGAPNTGLASRAVLRIGEHVIAYRWLSFELADSSDWITVSTERVLHRGTVVLILDPRISDARDVPARADPRIASALSAVDSLPPVEVQWTVHPVDSPGNGTPLGGTEKEREERRLTIIKPDSPELAEGEDRAPITLRLPCYPTTAARGALPLTPATLIFNDPAYDRDLAGPPTEKSAVVKPRNSSVLPTGRGELRLVLSADRKQVNRRGVVTFMLDVRFERPMDEIAQANAEANKVTPGGDLMLDNLDAAATLLIDVQPKQDKHRPLRIGKHPPTVKAGVIYELTLATLSEADGAPARLSAGDILVMTVLLPPASSHFPINIWNSESRTDVKVDLAPMDATSSVSRELRLVLTDEPVVEPPPALYAALLRTPVGAAVSKTWRIATALHAQSPLPSRVDLVEPARGFRKGLMKRTASFVWTLLRPGADFAGQALSVIKSDRNGQTHLPETAAEFIEPEAL